MDPIIPRRSRKKHGRIRCPLPINIMVRRIPLQITLPILRIGIAVLGHPRRTRQQFVEPPHVEQRHGNVYRPEKVGGLGEHVSREEAAVGSSSAREGFGGAYVGGD